MKKGIDYIGVGVGAVLQNNEGKFFLSQRGIASKNEPGTWEFPGGAVEFGQTLEEAIVVEMKEEFGIEISIDKHMQTNDHIVTKENQHWVGVTFLCKLVSGEPKILEDKKCSAIGWFDVKDIEKLNLSLVSQKNLAWIKDNIIYGD